MKKNILLSAATLLTATVPMATVISCGMDFGKNFKRSGGDMYVITADGSVRDKSFNEFVFRGTREFAEKQNKTFSYIQSQSATKSVLQKAYKTAINKSSDDIIILPGFTHGTVGGVGAHKLENSTELKPGIEKDFSDVHWVGIEVGDSDVNNRVYSQNFKGEESSFLAAIYAGIYMNEKQLIVGETLKVGGFGGLAIPPIINYLNGFAAGIEFFNKNIDKGKGTSAWKKMELIHGANKSNGSGDFSGSFTPGDGTALSNDLLTRGAQIIIAVAGGQTSDVVGAIKEQRKIGKAFAIGVDVDQSKAYDPKAILGSAAKGIGKATKILLKEIYNNISTTLKNGDRKWTYDGYFGQNTGIKEKVVNFIPSQITDKKFISELVDNQIYKEAIIKVQKDANPGVENDEILMDDKLFKKDSGGKFIYPYHSKK